MKHRDYTFLGLTQSLCPLCLDVVPAKIIARGKRVYFRKTCPTHGPREDFICGDVARYDMMETSLPAKLPAKTFSEPKMGCPMDCGLCSEHEQHTCIGVIEITDGCNLTCPMCYAGSAPGQKHKTFEQVRSAVDRLVEAEGRAEVLQFSGGEPTLHPQLVEMVEYALARPVDYVMINTNGIRLARDEALVEQLAKHRGRLEIYLQFDSLHDDQVRQLRGESGLVDIKLQALERLAAADLNVTLVATLQGGVNDAAAADLVDFAKTHPNVTGLSFQPATYSGRHTLPDELEHRITYPDVIDSIAADPRNRFRSEDFVPLPCAHPNCHWIGLAARDGATFHPLSQYVDAHANLDLLANGISFTKEQSQRIAQQLLARMACGPDSGCCSPDVANASTASAAELPIVQPSNNQADAKILQFLESVVAQSVGARDFLRITITSFLDAYNFDVRRVMKCCTHHVLPTGHIIPFCAYNVLYRSGHVPLPQLQSTVASS